MSKKQTKEYPAVKFEEAAVDTWTILWPFLLGELAVVFTKYVSDCIVASLNLAYPPRLHSGLSWHHDSLATRDDVAC